MLLVMGGGGKPQRRKGKPGANAAKSERSRERMLNAAKATLNLLQVNPKFNAKIMIVLSKYAFNRRTGNVEACRKIMSDAEMTLAGKVNVRRLFQVFEVNIDQRDKEGK